MWGKFPNIETIGKRVLAPVDIANDSTNSGESTIARAIRWAETFVRPCTDYIRIRDLRTF